MFEDLLGYYERELSYVRRQGAAFAKANPKIAGRLRIGPESVDDPHVSRLIEAFAFLNARVHRKLDDDFPELIDGLLGVLYPHYLAPIPSMAIAQFAPQADLAEPYLVPRHAPLRTEAVAGEPCRFRTCYPVTLWPVTVESARLAGRPLSAPHHAQLGQAQSVLRLRLQSINPALSLSALPIDRLRFFLAGQPQEAAPLHELILNDCIGLALADSPNDPSPTILPPESITPVGFERDEGMLDYTAHAQP
ncbi:MAG: type VI secretion system baseplate subunit TssF, partial [Geminicoccaceae bacterium]